MSTIGTKYNKGDVVIKQKYKDMNAMQLERSDAKFWDVIDIEDPDSRSPTYVLRERGNLDNMERAKASDLKKMF